MKTPQTLTLVLLAFATFFTVQARAIDSVRLTDTIKQGSGAINLLKDLTPAQLQQTYSRSKSSDGFCLLFQRSFYHCHIFL